jgi:hypothetical protein
MGVRTKTMGVTATVIAALSTMLAGAPAALALTVGPNVNLSARSGNQVEGAIAVDPNNRNRVYAVAMNASPAESLIAARSSDGGATWTKGTVTGAEGLPLASADPSLAWDAYGNLFLSYINNSKTHPAQVLALSTDGGVTFKAIASLASLPDQPTVTTGRGSTPGTGSVWVSWKGSLGYIWAAGAPVTGLGSLGAFQPAQQVPGTQGLSYGDIAVGPSGEVMLSMGPETGLLGGAIYTATSPGLGSPFSGAQMAATTGVGGQMPIPAQPTRAIDPESGLAYDRSLGAHHGRVYLMYTDVTPAGSASTQLYVRHSDDKGATWSSPVKVNDDPGEASHFLPRLALDESTGNVAVTWYDTRNDPTNISTEFWGAFSTDGGASFGPNFKISEGKSNQAGADPPPAGYPDLDYGDYTGASFAQGALYPIWADNSNSTGDNPDGTLSYFDVYSARIMGPGSEAHAPTVQVVLPAANSNGWYTTTPVTAQVTAADSSAEATPIEHLSCSEGTLGAVTGLGTTSAAATLTLNRQGVGIVTCDALNAASLKGESAPVSVRIDSRAPALAPTFTPSGSPILLNAVASAAANASDPLLEQFASGIASSSCGPVETSSAGPLAVSCTATDQAGNTTSEAVPYTVGYAVAALKPTAGKHVKKGGSVTVSFELAGAGGVPIPTVLAAGLGCTVTVGIEGANPVCPKYQPRARLFTARVQIPAGLQPGTLNLRVQVSVRGVVVGGATVALKIVA